MSARPRTVHPDPQNPFLVDVRRLSRNPGEHLDIIRDIPAPEHFGTSLVVVPAGVLIHLQARAESVMEGVLLSGRLTAPLQGECGRCLDEFTDTAQVRLQELYTYPERLPDLGLTEAQAADEDIALLVDDVIDLEPAIRDALVLSLPLNPLCDPDCLGLDEHGNKRSEPATVVPQLDERWAALRSFSPSAQAR